MFSKNSSNAPSGNPRPKTVTYAAKSEASAEQKPRRDFKKLFLVIGLGALSWVATYVGMLELIEANLGELPLVHKVIIGFSVAMLMTMIIWLLDQMFAPNNFVMKLLYSAGYAFLTLISIGFSFGFYWKVLESKSEATRGAESAITQVQGSLYAASTRLDQLQSTLIQLTAISTQKAEIERTQGTSCPNSKPGDGPRRKLRDEDAQRFTFASDFVKGRAGQVKTEMTTLDADLIKNRQGRQVDRRRQNRHPQRLPALRRPQTRPHRHRFQRLPHRSAVETDSRRFGRTRRKNDLHRYPRRFLCLPRLAIADRVARRRPCHRRFARTAEAASFSC